MHSGFEIPGVHQQGEESTCAAAAAAAVLPNILDQIPTHHHLFLDHGRLTDGHHYLSGAGAGAYFPLNFKLGLNEVCTDDVSEGGGGGGSGSAALLRGSEQYQVPEATMLHCWQNQEDSAIKPHPFWEPLPAEVSNENSEIVDRQEQHMELNQNDTPAACLDTKRRPHFGELEAIYKRLGTDQTATPNDNTADAAAKKRKKKKKNNKKKKKKKTREESGDNHLISPMMDFFVELVKKVMDHQENLHKKFAEVVERLDEERRTREETWRNEEMVHLEQEAAARARERVLAENREAMIVSYLEKITGQKITLPAFRNKIGETD